MKLPRRFPSIKGFTLIELLVVIAIIGILASVGIFFYQRAVVNARDQTRKQDLNQLKTALELYFDNHGSYPPETTAIGDPSTGTGFISCFGESGSFRGISWGGTFSCNEIVYMKSLPKDPTAGTQGLYCYKAVGINPPVISSDFFEIWAIMENSNNSNISPSDPLPTGCSGSGYNYKIENSK